MADAQEKSQQQNKGLTDPNEIGNFMLTICDRINESRDLLSADIREFMTRVKELNSLYAYRCGEVVALEKTVTNLKAQLLEATKQTVEASK
jgi:hypothetical protein